MATPDSIKSARLERENRALREQNEKMKSRLDRTLVIIVAFLDYVRPHIPFKLACVVAEQAEKIKKMKEEM